MVRLKAAVGSIVFFAAAPGVMGGAVPGLLSGWRSSHPPWWIAAPGAPLIITGVLALLQAFAQFVVEGFGTPAPIAPTEQLVIGAFYRHVRNPMYLAVIATILGQALLLGRPVLGIYAAIFWLIVATFVLVYEEPTLSERYGEDTPHTDVRSRPGGPGYARARP